MFDQSVLDQLKAHVDVGTAVVGLLATAGGVVSATAAKKTETAAKYLLPADTSGAPTDNAGEPAALSVPGLGLKKSSAPIDPLVMHAQQGSALARRRIDERLAEAADACKIQRIRKTRSRFATSTLNIAQYILGVIIASSFIQQHLNPTLVGSMGVLVLVASAVKDRFHPEIDAEDARRKELEYSSMIDIAKDELTVLDTAIASGSDRSSDMTTLMKQLTARIDEIRNSEVSKPRPALEAPKPLN